MTATERRWIARTPEHCDDDGRPFAIARASLREAQGCDPGETEEFELHQAAGLVATWTEPDDCRPPSVTVGTFYDANGERRPAVYELAEVDAWGVLMLPSDDPRIGAMLAAAIIDTQTMLAARRARTEGATE